MYYCVIKYATSKITGDVSQWKRAYLGEAQCRGSHVCLTKRENLSFLPWWEKQGITMSTACVPYPIWGSHGLMTKWVWDYRLPVQIPELAEGPNPKITPLSAPTMCCPLLLCPVLSSLICGDGLNALYVTNNNFSLLQNILLKQIKGTLWKCFRSQFD